MSDTIYRQAAIDELREAENHAFNGFYKGLVKAHKIIAKLPSAQPEPCLDSIASEIKKTISETKENGKYHCANIRINGEMICFGLQLALEIIEEKRNEQSDKQTGGD